MNESSRFNGFPILPDKTLKVFSIRLDSAGIGQARGANPMAMVLKQADRLQTGPLSPAGKFCASAPRR